MKRVLKWIGITIGALVLLLVLVAAGLAYSTERRLNRTYDVQPAAVVIPMSAEDTAEGKRLASIYCMGCHGEDLGGGEFFNNPALAVIDASNLTPGEGGAGARYGDGDWVRAIRHGVDETGKPLFIMPSGDFYYFNDEHLGQIIAYLKSVPPVDRVTRERQFGLPGRILLALGMFGDIINAETIDHNGTRPIASQWGRTAEYGSYLVATVGCQTCHGEELAGGQDPDPAAPPAPDITTGGSVGAWSEAEFIEVIRTRQSPFMPYESITKFDDEELGAIYLYLRSLPGMVSQVP